REALLAGEAGVLVVGGGPAGLGAAIGAADAGARVVLAERYGFLGGNATAALVMPLMSFHTQKTVRTEKSGQAVLLPTDHGPGEPIVAGVLKRLLERLVSVGGAIPPSLQTGYVVPFDPEWFKLVALDLLNEAGVHFLLHAFASGVLTERNSSKINGAVFETKSGPVAVKAKVVIDCTGDADMAVQAGAPFEVGRADGLAQPMTLMFRMVEFNRKTFEDYVRGHPDQWRGVHGLWDLVRKATQAGHLSMPREDVLFFATPHEREVSVNSTRVTRVLGTDVWDLTYAECVSRAQMRQISEFLRRYVPGFESAYAAQSGINIGVRETRRILGEYQLTANDVLGARKFPDAIARGAYPIDIHNPAGSGTVLKRLPPGESYDVPLRCLLPQEVENLLVAGRCISGTHEAHSSYRVMPIVMATGHAAGVGAALAVQGGVRPREVPAQQVQHELLRQGASLRHSVRESKNVAKTATRRAG
ncbi:MAG TPA: FAD-dependent oxidoreductase, partial [Steroidobacteraceae bacterium]|nr:FAD-dependent oxidoreductase [Steroidobacteraceae bacterium]